MDNEANFIGILKKCIKSNDLLNRIWPEIEKNHQR